MAFEHKLHHALALLAAGGITRPSYAPPIWRAAWSLRIPVPPPHFAGIRTNMLFLTAWIVLAGSILLMLTHGFWLRAMLGLIPVALFVTGLTATSYRNQSRRHGFPSWATLSAPGPSPG